MYYIILTLNLLLILYIFYFFYKICKKDYSDDLTLETYFYTINNVCDGMFYYKWLFFLSLIPYFNIISFIYLFHFYLYIKIKKEMSNEF